mgnify:CR=1 FL=1
MNVNLSKGKITWKRINLIFLIIVAFFLLSRAGLGQVWYAEIDSNMLPTISMQYHGSILMDESDLKIAQRDYPELYKGINTYDDLRSVKLLQTNSGKWMSYYFPIYPLFCMPLKLFFQLISVDQSRCFLITNALLVLVALWMVLYRMNVSVKRRLAVACLLIISPIVYYINYINYEAFIFAILTIALVHYINHEKCKSAFFLSLAGMANSTVMVVGIVMIAEYGINMLRKNKHRWCKQTIKACIKETILYGICFSPSLIPFVAQFAYRGQSTYGEWVTLKEFIGVRFLTYLFDPTVGLFSFASIGLLLFLILIIVACCRKHRHSIVWLCFFTGSVGAFSLMFHINCGMIYCARYIVWVYPIVPLYICKEGVNEITTSVGRVGFTAVAGLSVCIIMMINQYGWNVLDPQDFNYITKQILNYAPQLYNPYSATFYCRTLHIDGAYDINEPAYYLDSKTGNIRKIIFRADADSIHAVKKLAYGDQDSMDFFDKKVESIPLDEKFHYISLPRMSRYQLTPAPKSLASEEMIYFAGENRNADLYVSQGLSSAEENFAWTDGSVMRMTFMISDYKQHAKYKMILHCLGTFNGKQNVEITQKTVDCITKDTICGKTQIEFDVIPDENGYVELTFTFPDAISPKELGESDDTRQLAIQLQYGEIYKQ